MRIFQLNIDRDLHISGLCDWCGQPKGAGHVCPVDIPDVLDGDDYDLDDDELLLEDGEVS